MKDRPLLVVAGSLNMDLVIGTECLPVKGQTVVGDGFYSTLGGKGANQAVAAARLGADVRMVGRVGEDVQGRELLIVLQMKESMCQAYPWIQSIRQEWH